MSLVTSSLRVLSIIAVCCIFGALVRASTVYLTYPDPEWEIRILGEKEIETVGDWEYHSLFGEAVIEGVLGVAIGTLVSLWSIAVGRFFRWSRSLIWILSVVSAPTIAYALFFELAAFVVLLVMFGAFFCALVYNVWTAR